MYGRRGRRLRHGTWAGVVVLAGLVCAVCCRDQARVLAVARAPTKVRICHATSSHSNPYVSNEPAIANNGDLQGGHLNHTGPVFPAADWGDIIPPYDYVDGSGVTQIFPGYNWSPKGQAIWQNGCELPLKPLTPILECVAGRPAGLPRALRLQEPELRHRSCRRWPRTRSCRTRRIGASRPMFQPGRVTDAFQVEFDGACVDMEADRQPGDGLGRLHAMRGSGAITIIKVLRPSTDHGRFNLEIDGKTAGDAAAVGDGGTTGTIAVKAGQHTVGRVRRIGHQPRQLHGADGARAAAMAGAGSGAPRSRWRWRDENVVCTITNTRKTEVTPPELKPLVPMLECVVFSGSTPEQAVWGYRNDNAFAVPVPIGTANGFVPEPADRGQPETFEPGRLLVSSRPRSAPRPRSPGRLRARPRPRRARRRAAPRSSSCARSSHPRAIRASSTCT